MTDPCKRHKADKSVDPDWTPVSNRGETLWGIALVYRCVRCDAYMSPRIANGSIKPTQREAMIAYGLPRETVDGFFPPAPTVPEPPPPKNYKAKPPVEVPLTSWPFRVSAHQERV